ATNDVDNISQTLQQTMGQLINSLLTIVGAAAGGTGCGPFRLSRAVGGCLEQAVRDRFQARGRGVDSPGSVS
ncbi:hypothetical protein, partial [Streptomyces niveus]|uniref:hypothetical protein n=1 Tax=Streptomyces niveus TaxID=193462 RepID=UPI00341BAFF8